ncbi:MAG: PAS domain S-box protein, partial [Gemmatimonadetes bacterium]|nr:PAS domain S-box protein [Gemmatimonadota bacterium]
MLGPEAGAVRAGLEDITLQNDALIALEDQCFERVRAGDRAGAMAAVMSDDYEQLKRLYSDAVARSEASIEALLSQAIARDRRSVMAATAIGVLVLLTTIGGVVMLARGQSAAALKESEQRSRLFIDTALDAMVAIDEGGTIREWNPQAERTFGYARQEALGRLLSDLVIPERLREAHDQGLARYLSTRTPHVIGKRIEVPALRKDGTEITIELAITPVHTDAGVWFNAFLRDITERKQTEIQLAHAQKLESIGQLAAGIAHEINTPAQYVGDNTRFLKESLEELLALTDASLALVAEVGAEARWAARAEAIAAMQRDLDLESLRP